MDSRFRFISMFNCEYCGCRVRVDDTSFVYFRRFGKSLQICSVCRGQLYIEDEIANVP